MSAGDSQLTYMAPFVLTAEFTLGSHDECATDRRSWAVRTRPSIGPPPRLVRDSHRPADDRRGRGRGPDQLPATGISRTATRCARLPAGKPTHPERAVSTRERTGCRRPWWTAPRSTPPAGRPAAAGGEAAGQVRWLRLHEQRLACLVSACSCWRRWQAGLEPTRILCGLSWLGGRTFPLSWRR